MGDEPGNSTSCDEETRGVVRMEVGSPEDEEVSQEALMEELTNVSENAASNANQTTASVPESPTKKKPSQPPRVISQDTLHKATTVEDVVEYEWPAKSGQKFFLQEQVAELLGVTSFKRRYPDLTRRPVEPAERDYLEQVCMLKDLLHESQMHGLTVLRSSEVRDLLSSEYSAIYTDYQKVVADRAKAAMTERAKQMSDIKMDAKKLKDLRDKAMKSVSEFNSDLQATKKAERARYWDLQTNILQAPKNRYGRLQAKFTRPTPYPVALVVGQYSTYYKKFSPEELHRLPLNTITDYEYLLPVGRPSSPPPAVVAEHEEAALEKRAAEAAGKSGPQSPMGPGSVGSTRKQSAPEKSSSTGSAVQVCTHCRTPAGSEAAEKLLKCAGCQILVHPNCIEMTQQMVQVVFNYEWHCIECKRCTVCAKPDREDEMMFCDRCDRGYHTFCVGLSAPPGGTWICENFCQKPATSSKGSKKEAAEQKTATPTAAAATPSNPQNSEKSTPNTVVTRYGRTARRAPIIS